MAVNSKEFLDRQPLLDYLERYKKHCSRPIGTDIVEGIERHVREMPIADVAPVVHARWEHEFWDTWRCSTCKREWDFEDDHKPSWNFCPHCGARMDGDEE